MRKLSEIKNEDALDTLVELIDPIIEVCKDAELKQAMEKKDKVGAIKLAVKNHKKEVVRILAILDGENPATYEFNIVTLPIKLMELFNDDDMMAFFASQGWMSSETSSGSATENTEVIEEA